MKGCIQELSGKTAKATITIKKKTWRETKCWCCETLCVCLLLPSTRNVHEGHSGPHGSSSSSSPRGCRTVTAEIWMSSWTRHSVTQHAPEGARRARGSHAEALLACFIRVCFTVNINNVICQERGRDLCYWSWVGVIFRLSFCSWSMWLLTCQLWAAE